MRHTGQPHLVQDKYKITYHEVLSQSDLLNKDGIDLGSGDTVPINPDSKKTIIKQNTEVNTKSPSITSNGVLANGVFVCSDKQNINKSYVDITGNTYNGKIFFWLAIDPPEESGVLNIETIKLTINKVYLDADSEDDQGISKTEMLNLVIKSSTFTHNMNSVTIDGEEKDIVKENNTITAVMLDENFNKTSNISIQANTLPVISIGFNIPEEAGDSCENVLYEITSVYLKGSFEANNTFHVEKSFNLDKKLSFIHLKKTNTFVRSIVFRNYISRAIYAITPNFELIDLPIVEQIKNPKYIFAMLEMFKAYGISSYCYDYKQLARLSVFDKETFSYKISLLSPGHQWKYTDAVSTNNQSSESGAASGNQDEIEGNYAYYDNNAIQQKTINVPIKDSKINITSNEIGSDNFSLMLFFNNNAAFYKNIYFMYEKKSVKLSVLSSKHLATFDPLMDLIEDGQTKSFLPASQLTQQALYGLTIGHAQFTWSFFSTWAPMSFLGGGAMFSMILATGMMFAMWAVIYSIRNLDLTSFMRGYRESYIDLGNFTEGLITSEIGRNTDVTQSYNNILFNKGNTSNAIMKSNTDSRMVPVIGTIIVTVAATEIMKPTGPHTADLANFEPQDFFDEKKDIFLTDELKAWMLIGFDDFFSYNYRSNAVQTMADRHYTVTPAAKTIYKSYKLVEEKNGVLYDAVFDMKTGTIFGRIDPGEVYGKPKLFKKKLQAFVDEVKSYTDSNNEYLKFLGKLVEKALNTFGYIQLKNVVLAATFKANKTETEQNAYDITHGEYFSTPIIYSHTDKTLTKPNTIIYNYPTKKGTVGSGKQQTKYGFYHIEDPDIEQIASISDYFRHVMPFSSEDVPYILT